MKILPIHTNYFNIHFGRQNRSDSQNNILRADTFEKNDNISNIQKYIENNVNRNRLGHCSLDEIKKMEGIQQGLKIFKGMNLNEIRYAVGDIDAIAISRGCHNQCSHCYASAEKSYTNQNILENPDITKQMEWEDYKQFITDSKELQNRLGFDLFSKNNCAFFYDSDPMFYKSEDINGNKKNISDVIKLFIENFDQPIQFDTAGWSVNDKEKDKIADKIVNLVVENPDNFSQVCVSINPFNSILERSYEECSKGNIESADRFKNIYIDRVVNAIYTFAPCMLYDKLFFIMNAINDTDIENQRGKSQFLKEIFIPVFLRLHEVAIENKKGHDIDTIKKITNPENLANIMSFSVITNHGRATQFFQEKTEQIPLDKEIYGQKLIDANGKIYRIDNDEIYETELGLNFANQNKKTQKLQGHNKDLIITKDMINCIDNPIKKEDCFEIKGFGELAIG